MIVVGVSMIIGFWFYQRFNPEIFMGQEGEVIGQQEINANPTGNYAGKTAGQGILHLTGKEEAEQLGNTQWVTITTEEIVGTDVYRLKPWVDPYSLTRARTSGGRSVSTGRRAPETTKGPALRAEAYQEYYLVKLPDSTYVLAQFSQVFAGKIKKEVKIYGKRRNDGFGEYCGTVRAGSTYDKKAGDSGKG